MSGIIDKATGRYGVVVLAIGAVSRNWYVCHNGRIVHKSHNETRARQVYKIGRRMAGGWIS